MLLLGQFSLANRIYPQTIVLHPESYKHYIDSFNANDQELYPQFIPNSQSWTFLSENIPLLDCPDKIMEETYYFRWWTYRKHIRKTPDGFVVLEFLPDVPWAGRFNTINCAAALHVYEGRWLHDQTVIRDYIRFWYRGGGDLLAYSCWMADALLNETMVTGDPGQAIGLLPDLVGATTRGKNRTGTVRACIGKSTAKTGWKYRYAEAKGNRPQATGPPSTPINMGTLWRFPVWPLFQMIPPLL
jgi:hypothetical protein